MKRKNLQLAIAILALLIFIGFMTETGPKSFFGIMLNIWVYRVAWLLISASFFMNYLKERKLEEEEINS